MPETPLHYWSLVELSDALRARRVSSLEVTQSLLARIARLDGALHAYARVTPEAALDAAQAADRDMDRGLCRGPLHGVPVAVKDLYFTRGVVTANGMTIHENFVPDGDAAAVARLRAAGAVPLGKLQMAEAATHVHHPALRVPVNPWNAAFIPGFSSSGAGVATAAGLCYGALASDTGGSIRIPAAANGVTGLKPTFGRVSRFGTFPMAPSLDTLGPIARTAADVAAILGVIAGADARDPAAAQAAVPNYLGALSRDLRGVRVGVDRTEAEHACESVVVQSLDDSIRVLMSCGAERRDITLPPLETALRACQRLLAWEFARLHEQTYRAAPENYGRAVARLIQAGLSLDPEVRAAAACRRAQFTDALNGLFADVDLIVTPAVPKRIPRMPAMTGTSARALSLQETDILRYTIAFNGAGHPALTFPAGIDDNGLPIGVQLVGRPFAESLLLRAGHAFQSATAWHARHPQPAT